MKKQELEKAIENGESVWFADKYCLPYEVQLTKNYYIDMFYGKESLMLAHLGEINMLYDNESLTFAHLDKVDFIIFLEYIFKTKEKAQHYHDHVNITRTETLPFLTWEEFKAKERIIFTAPKRIVCSLSYLDDILTLSVGKGDKCISRYVWYFCEENFYKAYDECVRLFKGKNER